MGALRVRIDSIMESMAAGAIVFRRSLLRFMVIILGLLAIGTAHAGQIMSGDELDSFVQGYYLHPKPEHIADAIKAVGPNGYVQKNVWGFTAFLGEVFTAHPDRLPEWQKLIARQDKFVRDFLQHSLDLCQSGGVLAFTGHSAVLNDMYWGAFFASGNPAYVRKLIDQLKYFDERKDKDLFFAGVTTKWSLLANAERHPLVRKTLEDARAGADARTREIIDTMFKQGADDARREMHEIFNQQKAAGIWK